MVINYITLYIYVYIYIQILLMKIKFLESDSINLIYNIIQTFIYLNNSFNILDIRYKSNI